MSDNHPSQAVIPRYLPRNVTDQELSNLAHIVYKDEWEKGYIEGKPIVALCGYSWVPSQNPDGLPVCQWCEDIMARIISGSGTL